MSSSLPDDINALKRLLAEQEALNRALLEKLKNFLEDMQWEGFASFEYWLHSIRNIWP